MFNHILIPVAPGHFREYARALEVSRTLLAPEGKLSVLSVLDEIPSYVDAYLPAGQFQKNLSEITEKLEAQFAESGVATQVVSGHAANKILGWAEKNPVDCIVIESHRPGFADYFLGSTAARVVRHAKCPVFVLR